MRRIGFFCTAAIVAYLAAGATPAGATSECAGLRVCVPVAGPWVVVPAGLGGPRPTVEYLLTCPKGYLVGGLDAELSRRAIDVSFLGLLGSPVNPGITTARSVVVVGRYVGSATGPATFRPHIGCLPASGAGTRLPTAYVASSAGSTTTRRVHVARVRPGRQTVTQSCAPGERLVAASEAFGFFTRVPPGAGLVSSVRGALYVRGRRVVVTVRADAQLAGVRAVVQVHALCSRAVG